VHEQIARGSRTSLLAPWPLGALLVLWCAAIVLTAIAALRYGYDSSTRMLSLAALAALVVTLAVARWAGRRRARRDPCFGGLVAAGLALGLLWTVEILINNVATPPVPLRDVVDDLFWAAVAAGIFALSVRAAYRERQFTAGVTAGLWTGTTSGLVACCSALTLVVAGMTLITHDPLNIAEWAASGPASGAPDMASYFAFETTAGALGHLFVLGTLMGGLLGGAGGAAGWLAARYRKKRPTA
jgi:hypothetical protein